MAPQGHNVLAPGKDLAPFGMFIGFWYLLKSVTYNWSLYDSIFQRANGTAWNNFGHTEQSKISTWYIYIYIYIYNMRQWIGSALVQIMACRLFGAKPLSKPVLGYCQLNPQEQILVKFYKNKKLFSRKNASKNIVCEIAAILSRGEWVKTATSFDTRTQQTTIKTNRSDVLLVVGIFDWLNS